MSTLVLRHYFEFNIALFNFVVCMIQQKGALTTDISSFKSNYWNLTFIVNYFYLMDVFCSNNRTDFVKLKIIPVQLSNY